MIRILIPNATGPTNIGDQAILAGLLNIIESTFTEFELIIHSSTPEKYGNFGYKVKPHLYYWAAFENKSIFTRISRLVQLFILYISNVFKWRKSYLNSTLLDLAGDYERADIILYVGGGYLRTTPGVTQSINLCMILFHFFFGKFFFGKKVVAPGSFGPFAYKWQERLTAAVLKNFDIVSVRERISYDRIKKYRMGEVLISADQALLMEDKSPLQKDNKFILGLTIRNWMGKRLTQKNNDLIIKSIVEFSRTTPDLVVRPIVQVSSIDFGDMDMAITSQVAHSLKTQGVNVENSTILIDLDSAVKAYGELSVVLGMRMHSNIIAATQIRPFVAIAYEHKTRGIAEMLGLGEYCLDFNSYSYHDLLKLLRMAYTNRINISTKLRERLNEIRASEMDLWRGHLFRLIDEYD